MLHLSLQVIRNRNARSDAPRPILRPVHLKDDGGFWPLREFETVLSTGRPRPEGRGLAGGCRQSAASISSWAATGSVSSAPRASDGLPRARISSSANARALLGAAHSAAGIRTRGCPSAPSSRSGRSAPCPMRRSAKAPHRERRCGCRSSSDCRRPGAHGGRTALRDWRGKAAGHPQGDHCSKAPCPNVLVW